MAALPISYAYGESPLTRFSLGTEFGISFSKLNQNT